MAHGNGDAGKANGDAGKGWTDLVVTVIIALAAVGTAWAGFQSSKWTGVQANAYAKAGALRTESTRESTRAGQFTTMDVVTFTAWLSAVNDERAGVPNRGLGSGYTPKSGTLSGVIYERFRDEFEPAVRAWIDTRPLVTKGAPATPFAMPQYHLASRDNAERLLREADAASTSAQEANQRSDNYVMTAVLLALVLFFASLTGRTSRGLNRRVLLILTLVSLATAAVLLATYPIEI